MKNILSKITFNHVKHYSFVALIIIGICIILAPWFNAWRFNNVQKQLIRFWSSDAAAFAVSSMKASANAWSVSSAVMGAGSEYYVWEEDTNPAIDLASLVGIMEGLLIIDKINLRVPILGRYTIDNLNVSICSVLEANRMGQPGNYVLAGHNSRIYGRHFSRLKELSVGDIIIVENKQEQFSYQITDTFSVAPTEVWVMENDGEKRLITLITCCYLTQPPGRFIARGEIVDVIDN